MTATLTATLNQEVTEVGSPDLDLSIEELDLERIVQVHEGSERLICEYLVAMRDRRGYEKFGFVDIYYYAEERFGFSPRKTRYLLQLGQSLERLPQLKKALEDGKLGWTKASRVARVATSEDETMWLDSALSLSVRELDRKIEGERDAAGVKVRAWLTEDQAAVFDHAVEVCRRVAGEDLDIGRCLEFMAGEFIATYAHLGQQEESDCFDDCGEQPTRSDEESAAVEPRICPDGDDLPWPVVQDYGKTWSEVLERDDYRCQYPDCGARAQLHVHHMRFRSRSGSKSRAESNSPANLITLCVFHHRMIHAGTIGLKGRAPAELEWRRPALMENVLERNRAWQTFAKTESVSKGNSPFASGASPRSLIAWGVPRQLRLKLHRRHPLEKGQERVPARDDVRFRGGPQPKSQLLT